jgi:hypothetical protein
MMVPPSSGDSMDLGELHPIAIDFVVEASTIMGKELKRYEIQFLIRWIAWYLDSDAVCSDPRWQPMAEMQARHKAMDFIEFIHYIADIVQSPHPRYKNKSTAFFEEREAAKIERAKMTIRGLEKKDG